MSLEITSDVVKNSDPRFWINDFEKPFRYRYSVI